MKYYILPNTGLPVSRIAFGSYLTFGHTVDLATAQKLMATAYDLGVNLFDNAEIYSEGIAEEIMGSSIKALKWKRDTYVIMTKIFWGGPKPSQIGLHRKHIIEGCNASLKRLNIDYIDILVCHRRDPNTPIIEVVKSMNLLIQQGKILYWGTSQWKVSEILEAILLAEKYNLMPPILEQCCYNMFERTNFEMHLKELIHEYKLGIVSTMPLASGILTGKYNNDIPKNSRLGRLGSNINQFFTPEELDLLLDQARKLSIIAKDLDITLAELAIAWCLINSSLSSVIIGASNKVQLQENIKSLQSIEKIDIGILKQIDSILENKPIITIESFDYNMVLKSV